MNYEKTLGKILGTIKQLEKGEKVIVEAGYKERTLTVTATAEYLEREPYRCNATVIYLEGYGTEYRLECPERDSAKIASLHYPSARDVSGELVKGVEPQGRTMGIVAEKTAADMGIPLR